MEKRQGNGLFLFLLVIGFPFFFFGGPGYHDARSFKAVWDLGHILFFTLASLVLFRMVCLRVCQDNQLRAVGYVFLIVLVAGTVIEFVQMGQVGRISDVRDLLRNQLGVLVGSLFFLDWHKGILPAVRRPVRAVIILLLVFSCWPFLRVVIDEKIARQQFPVLSDFETPFEISRWHTASQLIRVGHPVAHGNKAMRVQLSTSKYSGTSLFYFPGDWSGYSWLYLSVFNPIHHPLKLHIRIHDAGHGRSGRVFKDRFNTHFVVHPGWNTLKISLEVVRMAPENREMDMRKIVGFGMFVIREPRPIYIFLDNIYLSK